MAEPQSGGTHSVGKRVVDITKILDSFEAQEGEVEQIIGQTGQGKTYEATRRALNYLYSGYVVYTTWKLNLPEYYDERSNFWRVLMNLIFFKKNFYRFNLRENWHYVNLEEYEKNGIVDTEALARFIATRTDCIFMLDEGQDVFDSHTKSGKITRQSITRTRHMHKTLIIISQRAQAVDVTARANVTHFYKCEKKKWPFFPLFFRVYRTEEVDQNSNYPLWERHNSVGDLNWRAPIWHSGFAKKKVYDAYDSWYMRKQMIRSQNLHIDAYELSGKDKIKALLSLILPKRKKKPSSTVIPPSKKIAPLQRTKKLIQ